MVVIAVAGSTGMMGHTLMRYLASGGHTGVALPRSLEWNERSAPLLEGVDAVVNCVGAIPQRTSDFRDANVGFPLKLADLCREAGVHMIHLSTDCVFEGKAGSVRTSSATPDATSEYGKSKAEADAALSRNENVSIVRASIVGHEDHRAGQHGFLAWVRTQKNGTTVDGYTNHRWNGLTCLEMAKQIVATVERTVYWGGAQHWGTLDVVTKADMVRCVSDTYGKFLTVRNVETERVVFRDLALDVIVEKTVREMIQEQFLWWRSIQNQVVGKRITIIGGTGSLGHSLVDRFQSDNEIQVVSRDELKQLNMERAFPGIHTHLGDMRDHDAICKALRAFDPHIVIVAAALKQIDRCEKLPEECIKTNIQGIQNCLDACEYMHRLNGTLESALLVSTDKACEPTNVYGMSKSVAERMVVNKARLYPAVQWNAVRYGNVVASRGSIIPFLQSFEHSKFLPLTSDRMTRFLMTLPQSVQLIHHALQFGVSGDTFVPASLKAVLIKDVFAHFSKLYAIPIKITGLRPGEKLHETLVSDVEAMRAVKMTIRGHETYVIRHSWAGIDDTQAFHYSSDQCVVEDAIGMLRDMGEDL